MSVTLDRIAELAQTQDVAVVVGQPVAHSLSPALHQAAYAAAGVDMTYEAVELAPAALADGIERLHGMGVVGVNVTIPHKEAVMALCATVDRQAQAIGAVNTLVRTDAGWDGHNTDIDGFIAPLATRPHEVRGHVVILGAGGAARAAVSGSRRLGAERITVVARRIEQARALADDLGVASVTSCALTEAASAVAAATLVVNATPLGLQGESLPAAFAELPAGALAYDLLYMPTPWQQLLRDQGRQVIGGGPMFVGQAARAAKLWTGRELDGHFAAAWADVAPR